MAHDLIIRGGELVDGTGSPPRRADVAVRDGVTTVVAGNCGVGFAPVRPGQEGWLIELMEGVEDLYGFADRGRVAEGLRADLNVIDLDGLRLHAPRAEHDLPAGGLRLLQDATGYRATIVAGEITRCDGADTGARPGRLLR